MSPTGYRQPPDLRIELGLWVSAQPGPPQATPPTWSAKSLRQLTPPTDTAKWLRQSESANLRTPTASAHTTPSETCRSSHRRSLMSLGSNLGRHGRHRQQGPPPMSAKQVRQFGPPTSTAKSRSAKQREPTVGDRSSPSETHWSSHQGVLMSAGPDPLTTPPQRSANSLSHPPS